MMAILPSEFLEISIISTKGPTPKIVGIIAVSSALHSVVIVMVPNSDISIKSEPIEDTSPITAKLLVLSFSILVVIVPLAEFIASTTPCPSLEIVAALGAISVPVTAPAAILSVVIELFGTRLPEFKLKLLTLTKLIDVNSN